MLVVPQTTYGANKHKKLTDDNVTAFIKETTRITKTGVDGAWSPGKIVSYLEKHIYNDAQFKTIIRYQIPGHPPQESAISLDKQGFIENIRKGAEAIDDYDTDTNILSIRLSRDKKRATVQTKSTEKATLPVPDESGRTQMVPLDGTTLCTQILRLSKKGIIQMDHAACATDVQFKE
jgi:hypothetical protein